jgi:hypothetical protein
MESTGKTGLARHGLLLAGLSAATLFGCGGGAETTENPVTGVTPPSSYSGPPPATDDIQSFKLNVWDNVQASNRCGGCHTDSAGQNPMFARHDDVNLAYEAANTVANLSLPSDSRLVTKLAEGHNCWLSDDQACADIMTTWIEGWAGAAAAGGRQIVLEAPVSTEPGSSKNYANASEANFAALVHSPVLTTYCADCHSSQAATSQQPYFADPDVAVAYEAAKPRMDLDSPAESRFVIRLGSEFHNCWDDNCAAAAAEMQAAIQAFADTVPITEIDPALVNSKALRIIDGTVASGGNRYEGPRSRCGSSRPARAPRLSTRAAWIPPSTLPCRATSPGSAAGASPSTTGRPRARPRPAVSCTT